MTSFDQQIDDIGLSAARERMHRELREEGETICPCCKQLRRTYHRTLHATMARQLILAYRLGAENDYIHTSQLVPKGATGSGDFTKARYWDLITPAEDDPDEARHHPKGKWRLTSIGVDFVKNLRSIPRACTVLDDQVLAFDAELTNIAEALGTKFDFAELMDEKIPLYQLLGVEA